MDKTAKQRMDELCQNHREFWQRVRSREGSMWITHHVQCNLCGRRWHVRERRCKNVWRKST